MQSLVAYGVFSSAQLGISIGKKNKNSCKKMLNNKGRRKELCGAPMIIF